MAGVDTANPEYLISFISGFWVGFYLLKIMYLYFIFALNVIDNNITLQWLRLCTMN